MSDIRIVAEVILKPGQRDTLMPILQDLVSGSRAEDGNRGYELTCNLENADHLFVIETWASEEAIAEHNTSPHFQSFVEAIENRVERMTVNKLTQLV